MCFTHEYVESKSVRISILLARILDGYQYVNANNPGFSDRFNHFSRNLPEIGVQFFQHRRKYFVLKIAK